MCVLVYSSQGEKLLGKRVKGVWFFRKKDFRCYVGDDCHSRISAVQMQSFTPHLEHFFYWVLAVYQALPNSFFSSKAVSHLKSERPRRCTELQEEGSLGIMDPSDELCHFLTTLLFNFHLWGLSSRNRSRQLSHGIKRDPSSNPEIWWAIKLRSVYSNTHCCCCC